MGPEACLFKDLGAGLLEVILRRALFYYIFIIMSKTQALLERTKPSNPVRWKYDIIIEAYDNQGRRAYCVFDRPGGERSPKDVPEHRRFFTLDEAKRFIEAYERSEGYACG